MSSTRQQGLRQKLGGVIPAKRRKQKPEDQNQRGLDFLDHRIDEQPATPKVAAQPTMVSENSSATSGRILPRPATAMQLRQRAQASTLRHLTGCQAQVKQAMQNLTASIKFSDLALTDTRVVETKETVQQLGELDTFMTVILRQLRFLIETTTVENQADRERIKQAEREAKLQAKTAAKQ